MLQAPRQGGRAEEVKKLSKPQELWALVEKDLGVLEECVTFSAATAYH